MAVKAVPKWLAQSRPTYVHTHPKYFYELSKDPEVLTDFKKYLKQISVDILEDHLKYWEKLRKQLISETNKIRKERGQSPLNKDGFLQILNNQLQSKNSKMVNALMNYKQISRELLSALDRLSKFKEKKTKNARIKILDDVKTLIQNSWQVLIDSLAIIASEFEKIQQSTKVTDQKTIKSTSDFKVDAENIEVVNKTLTELSILIKGISEVLGIELTGKTVSAQFLNLIKKIKTDSKILNKMGNVGRDPSFESNPLLGVMASLATGGAPKYLSGSIPTKTNLTSTLGFSFEVAAATEFVEEFTKQFSPGRKDIRTGQLWYKFSTSDILVTQTKIKTSGKTKETTFNYGASLKLTRFPGLSRTYKTSDYENTKYFKSRFVKTTGLQASQLQNYLKSLEYLRANISGLDSFSIPADEEVNPSLKSKWLQTEKDIAGIFTVIRALDGVYDYNSTVRLKEKDTEIYHTSFINIRDQFIWMEDLLRDLIKKYKKQPRQAFSFKTASFKNLNNKISSKEAQELWNVKRKEMRRLKKLSEDIQYENLYDAVNSSSVASAIEKLSKKPFNEITVDVKIGNLDIYKKIKS